MFDKVESKPAGRRGNGSTIVNNVNNNGIFDIDEFMRRRVNQLKLNDVKTVFPHCFDTFNKKLDKLSPIEQHIYFMLTDMSYFYISRTIVQKPVNISSHYLIIKFANTFVENINLNKLLQDEAIKNKLAVDDTFRIPNISYSYTSPIRSKVTNYREVIFSGLYHEHMICDCEDSIFKNKDHSHVVTGNLEIVDNNELRQLLSKGLNY